MSSNLNKLLFLSSMMMGTIMSISSNTWFGVWMGLEINLLSFIPLMMNDKNMMINESSIKYFIVQAIASTMLMFTILVILMKSSLKGESEIIPSMMISSSLLMKMGATPFHMWFPEVMKASSWYNCLILMTWQKMAPIMTLSYCLQNKMFTLTIAIISVMIGAISGLNQTSLRLMMSYSSISHIGWMISSMTISETLWETYFIVYSILSTIMISFFNQAQLFFINQMFTSNNFSTEMKFIMITSLLSLGGLPPFLGFLPKWMVIQSMIENSMTTTITIMVILTTINLYYYLRVSFSALILTSNKINWTSSNNTKTQKTMMTMLATMSSLGLILTTSLISIL
uniref:NADH dehydrogenase subunit 2 n=1 Tax=Aularches miliaris TaxID=247159 RepID=UPI00286A884F|nr:NADH dehydrogenase subunit 2 [Aularches miliaris]WLG65243.1 NADH dehydrogenase subunit 2 [Aularches miliaris]